MFARTLAVLSALGFSAPVAAQALEAPRTFAVDYSFSILGFNVGRSTFRSTISGDTFSVNGTVASSGIARVFDSTKGTTSITGRFAGSGLPRPDSYALAYTSGKRAKRTEIAFSNGAVTSTQNVPPPKKRPATWKPLGKSDLVAVADPISATLVKASSLQDVCSRTLKVYDGEMRADLNLSFAGTKPAKTTGFDGEVAICSAKFVPVGGYKQGDKTVEFLKNKGKIVIYFAELGDTGIYAPLRLTAATEIGTLTMTARRFEAVK